MFLFFCRGHSPLLTFASMPLLLSLLRCLYKVKNTRATRPLGFCRKQSRFSFRSFRSAAKGKQQYFYFYFHGEPKVYIERVPLPEGRLSKKGFIKKLLSGKASLKPQAHHSWACYEHSTEIKATRNAII